MCSLLHAVLQKRLGKRYCWFLNMCVLLNLICFIEEVKSVLIYTLKLVGPTTEAWEEEVCLLLSVRIHVVTKGWPLYKDRGELGCSPSQFHRK